MEVKQRLHLMPLGYEYDRIVDAAEQQQADFVILLDYRETEIAKQDDDIVTPEYHHDIREDLKSMGIGVATVPCNLFDLYDSLGTIAEIATVFEDHNVHVNLASGSKVTAIGGMIACMATGARPYYVSAKDYAGGTKEPVAGNVGEIYELSKYPIQPPEPQQISCLEHIVDKGPVAKKRLIEHGENTELPFVAYYDASGVKDEVRGKYRRLQSQIIEPLLEQEYITIQERGRHQFVEATESGKNTVEAFHYLINGEIDEIGLDPSELPFLSEDN